MKKRILSILLCCVMLVGLLPTVALAEGTDEQFNLTLGKTYWFDLSGENIFGTERPGTPNPSVPDASLHYVRFTYAGTVDAYVLNSSSSGHGDASGAASQTTDENAQYGYTYRHSLFASDYVLTTGRRWDELNAEGLIFGRSYTSGSVDYTLRAPSVGCRPISSGGEPSNNEWDSVQDKKLVYIPCYVDDIYSWGQDSGSEWTRAARGLKNYPSAWGSTYSYYSRPANFGYRPFLEVLNTDELGPDGLKAVTLDLNGGSLGGRTNNIQIVVKNGATFTAPASEGLTRPDGDTGSAFFWKASDGKLYAPGASVPAGVTLLTAQWMSSTDPDTYTVSFNSQGGSVVDSQNVKSGETATEPTTVPTRAGFDFGGWYTNADCTTEYNFSTPVTGNLILYAKWTLNTYTVTINAGANMTLASGNANQSGLSGAMTATVYTAADGYYFPTDYAVEEVNGISVTRNSYTQITVSGTPTANTTITLAPATAKTKATAPTGVIGVACTTSDNNDGKLQNVTAAMEYKKSDDSSWTDCGGTEVTGLADGTYYVRVKATGTVLASDYVEVTVAEYTAPPHTHCICGGDTNVGDHTTHTDVTYQPWDGTSAIDYGDDNTAYVYLANNVTIQESLEIAEGKTLYLCLNGKTFASNGTKKIEMRENSHFILCDCASGGTIDGADSCWGGAGIYLHNSTMDMYGGKITGGHTGNGGGGAIALDDVNCVFNMYGGEISGNKADRYGGAIFLNGTLQSNKGGTVNLYGGTIKNNSAQLGGAIYAVYGGTVNLFGGEISGNTATVNGGGAICLNHSGVLNMTGGKMQNNTAKTYGGAVNLYASTFTFSGGTISNNYASKYGGAVYLSISGKLNMTGGEICNNTAKEEGGAVHVYGENATFNFSGGTITGNEAVDGGAVYLNQELSTLNMTGGEISGNKATRNGGAVYMFRATSTLNLSGGTIKNNTAGISGGAVYFNTTSDGKIQGILNISGNPVVKDNTVSDKANNVSLKIGKTLSIVGDMTNGASVGITTESTDYPVVFSNAYDTNYAGYFFADDESAHVNYNSEKKLELADDAAHTHSWATAWSKNETHHWHECTADGCDVTDNAEKDGYAAHTYDQQVATDEYKASDATCTAKATYYKSCVCGAKGTETFESGEVNASNHTGTLSGWQTDSSWHWKEYSCCHVKDEEGKHVYTDDADTDCNICDYKRTITPSHTHSWAAEWSKDNTHHWHECTADGCDVTDNAEKDGYAAHSFEWVVDKEATATQKGSKHEECKACGYERPAVEIPATGSTTKPTDPTQSNPNTGALDDVPQTGDNSHMALWIVLLGVSVFGLAGIAVYSKRKRVR